MVHRIVREELWRSVVWAGLGLFGWAVITNLSDQLETNLWTVVGLAALTWAVLTAAMITIRLVTGRELKG